MTRPPKPRNPIAKAVTRVRPQLIPDKRRKLLECAAEEEPGPLEDLMPRHPLFVASWVGSLRYALSREDVMVAFREQTGNRWQPGRTPIDQMIDQATGTDLVFIRAFAKWHNEHIWGEEDGKPVDAA